MRAGPPTGATRTSGSSSSGTRSSSSRSRTRSTSAFPDYRRGRWRSFARRWCRGRAAPSSPASSASGSGCSATTGPGEPRAGAALREPQRARGSPRGGDGGALPRAWLRGGRRAIVGAFEGRIQYALTNKVDHKTELQEELARRGRAVSYALLDAEGPAHERTFTAAAMVDGVQAGVGRGGSKKDAEQEAARQALDGLTEAAADTPPVSGCSD